MRHDYVVFSDFSKKELFEFGKELYYTLLESALMATEWIHMGLAL